MYEWSISPFSFPKFNSKCPYSVCECVFVVILIFIGFPVVQQHRGIRVFFCCQSGVNRSYFSYFFFSIFFYGQTHIWKWMNFYLSCYTNNRLWNNNKFLFKWIIFSLFFCKQTIITIIYLNKNSSTSMQSMLILGIKNK